MVGVFAGLDAEVFFGAPEGGEGDAVGFGGGDDLGGGKGAVGEEVLEEGDGAF